VILLDALTAAACETPNDATVRSALADALKAVEKHELATAVENKKTGAALIGAVADLSDRTKLPPTYEMLWAVFALLPRLTAAPVPPRENHDAVLPLPAPFVPPVGPWRPWRTRPDPADVWLDDERDRVTVTWTSAAEAAAELAAR
jgi:hypothetical protein